MTQGSSFSVLIFDEKIIHKKMKYVCRKLKLQCVSPLKDEIGVYAYDLMDAKHRHYIFTCKRYIYFRPDAYGIVSVSRSLVEMAVRRGWTMILLIEDKEDDESRDYIYTYNPHQVVADSNTFYNLFNGHEMCNFDICLALNMEITRRREILLTRVELKEKTKDEQHDRMQIKVTRFF